LKSSYFDWLASYFQTFPAGFSFGFASHNFLRDTASKTWFVLRSVHALCMCIHSLRRALHGW